MIRFLRNLFKGRQAPESSTESDWTTIALAPEAVVGSSRRRRGVPEQPKHFLIPLAVVEATARVMRRFGREQRECYVWWSGYFDSDGVGQVLTAIYPEISTEFGRIHLNREQFGALQETLRALDQVLLMELHSHPPGAGGQNDVDAAHPAAPYPGFVTVVVPDFGDVNLADLSQTHVYEYLGRSRWRTLRTGEIRNRFTVDRTEMAVALNDAN